LVQGEELDLDEVRQQRFLKGDIILAKPTYYGLFGAGSANSVPQIF
jgi:hypothetical protein